MLVVVLNPETSIQRCVFIVPVIGDHQSPDPFALRKNEGGFQVFPDAFSGFS
ncbi:hypothetical protein M3027_20715 [Geoalkalibacter halelectricus]|nr:hypothetical protein [Geoalkalibacter halelectricus]